MPKLLFHSAHWIKIGKERNEESRSRLFFINIQPLCGLGEVTRVGDWRSKMLPYNLVTESEMTPDIKKQHWRYILGVCDKRTFCPKRCISPWLVAFINFILRWNTLALETPLQKFGLVEKNSCSLFMFPLVSFQEFAERQSSLRPIKASLYAFKASSVFESALHRKPHIYLQTLTWS